MKLTDRKLCNNKFTKSLLQEKQLCWKEQTVSYHPTNQNQWRAGRGGRGTMAPPAKIFRGRQTTTGALKLCKTKFSAKTLTLFKSHLEFIERNIRLSAV